jgi:hypothetical protein
MFEKDIDRKLKLKYYYQTINNREVSAMSDVKRKKLFYAVQFENENHECTSGESNKKTGVFSRAVTVTAFKRKDDRDSFVLAAPHREAIKPLAIRKLKAGLTLLRFKEYMMAVDANAVVPEVEAAVEPVVVA